MDHSESDEENLPHRPRDHPPEIDFTTVDINDETAFDTDLEDKGMNGWLLRTTSSQIMPSDTIYLLLYSTGKSLSPQVYVYVMIKIKVNSMNFKKNYAYFCSIQLDLSDISLCFEF